LEDPEAARCDLGARLFSELEGLRDLNERRELEIAKQALEAQVIQKELLLKEVNHRVKNSLQVVAGLLHLEVAHLRNPDAAAAMRGAATRVSAVAAVHERLYRGDDLSTVALDVFVTDLCGELGRALACPDIELEVAASSVPTDMAIPLALMINELVTNAIRHGAGGCRVILRRDVDLLQLIVSNAAPTLPTGSASPGMGSRILQGLARQIGATLATHSNANDYTVEAAIPLPKKQ
jgi:two-component sensor histidine kinase